MSQTKIVLKLGSLCVTDAEGGVNIQKISQIVDGIEYLRNKNYQVIVVSSGAINTGKKFIKNWDENLQITKQQAASAVGQPLLMQAYEQCLEKIRVTPAQVLVTNEDFQFKERFINIRNTLNCLLNNNLIPIINENDTTSFAEITVGDNDQLASMITLCLGADKLLILTESDGLFDRDPKDPQAIKLDRVTSLDDLENIKFGAKTNVGRGGMSKKLDSIKKLFSLGVEVRIGSYKFDDAIKRLIENDQAGTCFIPKKGEVVNQHKLWMQVLSKNDSYLIVDEGAYKALAQTHKSLLPIGIKKVVGTFKRGDIIQVKYQKKIVALGLTEYSSKELSLIQGKKTLEIPIILKEAPSKVAIHADNLLILTKA
jgi:glutamate 5-kinase